MNSKKYKDCSRFFLATVILVFTACSNPIAPQVKREYGESFTGTSGINFHAVENTISACERLDQLASESGEHGIFSFVNAFSFLADASGARDFKASIKLSQQPFLMYLISSPRIASILERTDEDFMEISKVLLKVRECKIEDSANWGSGCKNIWENSIGGMGCKLEEVLTNPLCQSLWAHVVAKKSIGKCSYVESGPPLAGDLECTEAKKKWLLIALLRQRGEMHLAKNKFLETPFSGIFGEMIDAKESLILNLVAKIKGFYLAGPDTVNKILSTKVPLYGEKLDWVTWKNDVEKSISSWTAGIRTENNVTERLCSFVLSQRTFAQLLAINGYTKPELNSEGNLIKFSKQRNTLGISPVLGVYARKNTVSGEMEPTIVSSNDYATYDPTKLLLVARNLLPTSSAVNTAMIEESLEDRLARVDALERIFEASSPLAAWRNSEDEYLLGDIEEATNSAILPAEMHALAFGMFAMNFKNLAYFNLRKVTASGAVVSGPQDIPAGIVLMKNIDRDWKGIMALSDISNFSNIVVRIDSILAKLLKADWAVLLKINPIYTAALKEKLISVHGDLRKLKLPLLNLMSKMNNSNGCISMVTITIAPGVNANQRFTNAVPCSEAELVEHQRSRKLLEMSVFQ